jgi:amino acid adenylation domain-containing protein
MNPDAVAIVSEEGELTFSAFLTRAQEIAAALRRRGAGPGTVVGLAVKRSPAAVVAMLGILITGGVYVPLELRDSPAHLLHRQVRASAMSIILCDQPFQAKDWAQPWWRDCELLTIAQLENELLPAGSDFSPANSSASDPAYIMFTSGSSGQPKGVLVPHRGIVRLVSAQQYLNFGPEETLLLHSPLGFDASTLEIWGSLLHGGKLVIAPPNPLAVNDYERLIVCFGVTTLWLSASVFHLIADHAPQTFATLRQLVVGGDVVSPQRVERMLRIHPDLKIVNGYGPTENTTFTTCYRVPHDYAAQGNLPIGKAIQGTRVYVLDSNRHPVSDGEAGELAAGGDGVALGYVDAPEATSARFVPDPFSGDPADRLYITGDRVRMRSDGNFEFLGRLDQEVKIAGHRVDVKELEEVLAAHPAVQQAVVAVVSEDSQERRLYGFVQLQQRLSGAAAMLKEYLSGRVQRFAVPSQVLVVEEIPLNANGKVDRQRLLKLVNGVETAAQGQRQRGEVTSPESENESSVDAVWNVWRKLLQRDDIGLDENFFDAGGSSLLLMELHIELNRRFPGKLTLMDLFAATTVRKISERLVTAGIGYENATLGHQKAQAN